MADEEPDKLTDPEAPWGRKADGSPRRKPGVKPGAAPRSSSSRSSSPPRRTTANRPAAGRDYRPVLESLAGAITLPLAFVSPIDAETVAMYSPPLIEAVNETAQEVAYVAAMLDRLMSVGPWSKPLLVAIPLLMQLGCNHGWIPESVATKMGAVPRAVMMAKVREKAQAAQDAEKAFMEAMVREQQAAAQNGARAEESPMDWQHDTAEFARVSETP